MEEIALMFELLCDVMVPIGICVILPVSIVMLYLRARKHETNKRTEILLAAIEKNAEIDVEDFLAKMAPPKKSIKQMLVTKLMWGSIITAIGAGAMGYTIYADVIGEMPVRFLHNCYLFSALILLVGVAILIVFFVSKKMLAKELRGEEELKK
jgi:magnesium-transporting ATPase (P-type)